MYIIVAGVGKIGENLAKCLTDEGHDLVVIDKDPNIVETVVNKYDIMGICGNAASYAVQLEAGVKKADLLISVTPSDELNIVCCLVAKTAGARRTMARVRNPEYGSQLQLMRNELGLSMFVNPELEGATEMARMLRFPSAIKMDSFSKGRVEIAEIKISQNGELAGKAISRLHLEYTFKVLICAVLREGNVTIPNGNFVLQSGDIIYITGSKKNITGFLKELHLFKKKTSKVLIIGGGRISYYLAKQLEYTDMHITLIEKDEDRCVQLNESLPKVTVIKGDGSDQNLLREEGLEHYDSCVALTGIDEENMVIAMYAQKLNVPQVIAKINRETFLEMIRGIGIDSVISPKAITADRIIRYIRAIENSGKGNVKTLYRLIDDQMEALEFTVPDDSRIVGKNLADLKLKPNILVSNIIRHPSAIITPTGYDHMEAGDSVIIITTNQYFHDLTDILA
ncbi:MAG: Trk system potassium transporter TrkA [Oscillospiraceae bacterium]|nr:Trk system potassium transporter TrkA [Oscillospiraceae bacterium]